MNIDFKKPLPMWWMAIVEIMLFITIFYFFKAEEYAEALLTAILMELRDFNWKQQRKS